jgi:hypothetical protein
VTADIRVSILTPTVNVKAKLPYLRDALACLHAQTMPDWEWILMTDHPVDYYLLDELDDRSPRIRRVCEAPKDRSVQHPMPFLFNKFVPQTRGEFVFAMSDDDLIAASCLQAFTDHFDANPESDACYVTLKHQYVTGPGITNEGSAHSLMASRPRGQGQLVCQIDGGQVCVRKSLYDKVPAPWWPETPEPSELRIVDGRYMDNMAQNGTLFQPAGDPNVVQVVHRFTPISTFTTNIGPV